MIECLEKIPWLDLVQTFAVIFTAYIANAALNTWKHQEKAKKQTDFLDHLTDLVHEYIQSLSHPISFLKFIYISFESHKHLPNNSGHKYSNIIAYIQSSGKKDSQELWELLKTSGEYVAKTQALVARGQVYGFENFRKCHDAIKMLLWQHQRLQVVASMVGSPSYNWDHPEVIKSLESMLTVQPDDIEDNLQKYNVELLEFVQENYQAIYKGT